MQYQLRIYKIKAGLMEEFIKNWRTHFVPVREQFKFQIIGSWVNKEAYEFIWLVGYAGPEGYAARDKVYYGSPERAAVKWDPMPYIEKMDLRILDPTA
jgi:hypothetical protein